MIYPLQRAKLDSPQRDNVGEKAGISQIKQPSLGAKFPRCLVTITLLVAGASKMLTYRAVFVRHIVKS